MAKLDMGNITDDQTEETIVLLRKLHADISACKMPWSDSTFEVDGVEFEWPNLAILNAEIELLLNSGTEDEDAS